MCFIAIATKLSPRERQLAGEQLVEDDAERVDVGALADRLALRLLGRDVVGGAEHGAGLRHALADVERARDPEVGHLRGAVAVQQHVLRLHVAVHEPVRVRERERRSRSGCPSVERALDRQRPLAVDDLLEVVAVDVLEDDELPALVLAAVDHA